MKRKLSIFLLAVVMLLGICPVATATTTATTPYLIDLRVEGNMVSGQTLKAAYEIPDGCEIDRDLTDATIKWGGVSRLGTSNNIAPATSSHADGPEYRTLVASDYLTNYPRSMFFTITPMKEDGNPAITDSEGNAVTLYSPLMNSIVTTAPTAPSVQNVSIIPVKYPGTMYVGDTVVANFSYFAPVDATVSFSGGTDPEANRSTTHAKYEWYAASADVATADLTTSSEYYTGVTTRNYKIRTEDSGKWLYCKITPLYGTTEGTAVVAKNHVGNIMLDGEVKIDGKLGYAANGYDMVRIAGNGSVVTGSVNSNIRRAVGSLGSRTKSGTCYVTFDAGEVVPFDGVYFRGGYAASVAITNVTLSYSVDNENWKSVVIAASNNNAVANLEIPEVKYARYFKVSATHSKDYSNINDFYPYLRTDAKIVTSASADYVVDGNNVTVTATDKTLADVEAALTTASYSGTAVTTSFVTATADATTGYLTETATLTDKTAVVTADTADTYLKVMDSKEIPTYYAVTYEEAVIPSDVTVSEDTVDESIVVSNDDMTVTVKTWNMPLDAVANAITATSSTGATVIKTFVTGTEADGVVTETGSVDAANTKTNASLANTYMKVVGGAGIASYYKVEYEELYTQAAGEVDPSTASYLLGTNAFTLPEAGTAYNALTGKYLLSTTLKVPAGNTIGMRMRTGTTATYRMDDVLYLVGGANSTVGLYMGTNGATANFTVTVPDANSVVVTNRGMNALGEAYVTKLRYVPGEELDVKLLLDYATAAKTGNPYSIDSHLWIDGVLVRSGKLYFNTNQANIFAPQLILGSDSWLKEDYVSTDVRYSNTSLKKIYVPEGSTAKAQIAGLVADTRAFTLSKGGVAVEGTTVAVGDELTLTADMDVYYGNDNINIIAQYAVAGQDEDGNDILKLVKAVSGATPSTTVESGVKVVKAFSFSKTLLVPNVVVGEWTVQ